MSELTSTAGVVALVAVAIALLALGVAAAAVSRLRRLRAAQTVVLGEDGSRDIVSQAMELERRVKALDELLHRMARATDHRLKADERRLAGSLSKTAVVRYDAYGEMSGRQSSTIALLDERGDGVLLSSILHREQARVYAKEVRGGESELGISPEEREAIDGALAAGRNAESPESGG
jgi:hypothetical protein